MTRPTQEPQELVAAKIERWECVRAWGQVMLCLHLAGGETRIYTLDRKQASELGNDLDLSSMRDPED